MAITKMRFYRGAGWSYETNPLSKTPVNSPIFKADSVLLHVSREKDDDPNPDPAAPARA